MSNPTAQRWEFVLRQFAQLVTLSNASIASVAEQLRSSLGPAERSICSEVEGLLSGSSAPTESTEAFVDTELRSILESTRAKGGNTLAALTTFLRTREHRRQEVAGFFMGLIDQGVYLAGLLIMLLAVAAVYVIFVLPQFASLYASMDADLPAFTQLFVNTSILLWPLFALIAFTVAGAWWAALRLRKRVLTLRPFSPRACAFPGIRGITRDHNTLLWLQYARVFLAAGLSSQDARDCASSHVTASFLPRMAIEHIDGAAKLGTLEMELDAQVRSFEEQQTRSLIRSRTAGLNVLRFVVYWWIGSLIIAMYLPIFKLGALI